MTTAANTGYGTETHRAWGTVHVAQLYFRNVSDTCATPIGHVSFRLPR